MFDDIEQSRESAAELQSMLFPVLLSNAPLTAVGVAKMEKLYRGIITNLESPLLDISPEVQKNIQSFKENEDWNMIALIYNSILTKAGEWQYGLDLVGFHETMEKAITLLDGPILLILQEVNQHVKEITQSTTQFVLIVSLFIIVAALLIFLIGRRFTYQLSTSLVDIAENLLTGAEGVSHASGNMATAAEGLSSATFNQANSLRETAASVEQAKGIEEITKTMNHLDEITQNNTSTSESAAKSAESLSHQSVHLKDSIASLVTIVHGDAS